MPRGNPQYLVVPTSEQARENGAAGGRASQESQRKKKQLREYLTELLDMQNKGILDDAGIPVTNGAAMTIRAVEAAVNGDWKAWELVRDTAGQKPVDRVMLADVDAETMLDVERLVEGMDEEQ